ncbi:MAG: SpoIIE family protein phosphatase [Chloracidobacterium sp.]|nr:SpoIIE family protein phosphatase [Chloracidobacterium sp.]
MKKNAIQYIVLAALFVFAAATLVIHIGRAPERLRASLKDYSIPFTMDGRVLFVRPEAAAEGLRPGDQVLTVNGVPGSDNEALQQQFERAGDGAALDLQVRRRAEGDTTEDLSLTIHPVPIDKNINYYLRIAVGSVFAYVLPLVSILLGFWVALVRPRDFVAWLFLFLLLGLSSLSFEAYSPLSVPGTFRNIFGSGWAISMFLFAVYFPERLPLEKRYPWAKYIIIVPLLFQVLLVLASTIRLLTGLPLNEPLRVISEYYGYIAMPLNMLAIGLFFMLLGWKSGTIANPDARRRLRVMVTGTGISMFPAFFLVLYAFVSGSRGSFFDVAPAWFALLALLFVLLFPLTMAYVIVVHRAMDVRVVVRQGLQYALAKGGVRVLQILLLIAVGMGVYWSINYYGTTFSAQLAFIVAGVALVPLIDVIAKPMRVWIDKRFFREAYDAEQILAEFSEDVRTMVETRPLLETVATRISESLHVPQVALLIRNGASFSPAYALGFDTPPAVSLAEGSPAIRKLSANRHIVLYDDMSEVTSTPTVSHDEREQLQELNSQILLPLSVKNQLSGIISLSPKRSEEPYTASDMRLLRSVASQTGLALENSRLTEAVAMEAAQRERLNAEVEIAREVQERLFPQELPVVAGLDYHGACRPALGVGGDYYDFLELPDGKLGFAIGDVSGKGIGASLMMASLQASLRGQTLHAGDDLAGLMAHVNTLVYEASTSNRYATFFYGQFDPATLKLSYVNAGHNPPFLLRPAGGWFEVFRLDIGGPVVGMLPSMLASYEQGELTLAAGDILVGFTDGISEAMDPDENEWGEDQLLDELKRLVDGAAETILKGTVEAADRFARGAKQHDDMTMIVLRVLNAT